MITQFQQLCIDYVTQLRELHSHALSTGELSLRPALDGFLSQTAELLKYDVQIVGEAKKIAAGRPDYTITAKDLPIGYIEAESYDAHLDKLTGHAKEQNDRFRQNLDNFLLTDHLEFRLYVGGELAEQARLHEPPETGKIAVTSEEAEELENLLHHFFQGQLPAIGSPKDLAAHLARRTRQIRHEVLAVLRDTDTSGSEMHEQFNAFKEVLLPDLSAEQFAGLYAQTITYGLFAARCMPNAGGTFSRQAAASLVPKTNPFLRKLFQRIAAFDLDPRVAWIADDTAQLLAKAPMAEILADFGSRSGKEDPVVHFYETFLAAYDPKVREVRGVYYTPEPVVSYIVRSIDHLLKTRFNKPLGLADEETLILDPATGTGSFLFAIVRQIYERVCQTYGSGIWNEYVKNKLLPRLFGFELLIAPYAVAHLKLGLQLQELGYTFGSDQRLGIYLTNTLEEAVKKSELLLGKFIQEEADEAAAVKKERPILVMLGNPPYSGHSANRSEYVEFIPPGQTYQKQSKSGQLVTRKAGKNGVHLTLKTFIGKLIEDYKQVDGKPLGEQNPKLLHDDYVKFIRFAQWRISRTGEGIVGLITNHGYLDNPTFRGMRYHLMQTFNEIYVYNLHGNSRKKEKPPEGGRDHNVFDIQQGVAILLCVKEKDNSSPAKVFHADVWGVRHNKYGMLSQEDIRSTDWEQLTPSTPFYLFVPQDVELLPEYEQGWKVTDMMPVNSTGIKTHRDHFVLDFDAGVLRKRIDAFRNLDIPDGTIAEKYTLKDTRDWKLSQRRRSLSTNADWENHLTTCLYRPFDVRAYYHHGDVVELPRHEVVGHLLGKQNFCLGLGRQGLAVNDSQWALVFASRLPVDTNVFRRGGINLFPVYLYPLEIATQFTLDTKRRPNFSPKFLKALSQTLNLPQAGEHGLPESITPEDIFHYAYAVFHSPTYRERYAEFLKIDFPRLPLTSDLDLFRDLAGLGQQLAALHLLDTAAAPALNIPTAPFPITGDNRVEKLKYDEEQQRVYLNKTQYFDNVPPEVWEFRVGGYQVCDKWLKDRKGRALTFDDIQQYQRIIIALSETMTLMEAIDERIPGWPLQ